MKLKKMLKSARFQISAFMFLAIFIAIFCFGIYFYNQIYSILSDHAQKEYQNILQQTAASVNMDFSLAKSSGLMLMGDPVIRSYLEPEADSFKMSIPKKRLDIEKQLSYLVINNSYLSSTIINSIYIFDSKGNFYQYNKNMDRLEVYDQNNRAIQLKFLSTGQNEAIFPPSGESPFIYLCIKSYSQYSGNYAATLVIDISVDFFKELFEGEFPNGTAYLINPENVVLVSASRAELGKELRADYRDNQLTGIRKVSQKNTPLFVISSQTTDFPLTAIVIIAQNVIFKELQPSIQSFMVVFILISLVIIVSGTGVSSLLTKPIKDMANALRRYTGASGPLTLPSGYYTELDEFTDALNKMNQDIIFYNNELTRKQLMLKTAELKALESQINPHFLFNVLETISWKAQLSNNDEIASMIVALARLMRESISGKGKSTVRLQEELENVKNYLYLEKIRFPDKFDVMIEARDRKLLDCLLPRLILQPIVENAIVHGIEKKVGHGTLTILITGDAENNLIIQVKDDGVGFDPAQFSPEQAPQRTDSTHIGLANVYHRIKLIYGEPYGMEVKSGVGSGTQITLRLPQRKEDFHA